VYDANQDVVDKLIRVAGKWCPASVAIRVERWEWEELGKEEEIKENKESNKEKEIPMGMVKDMVEKLLKTITPTTSAVEESENAKD